MGRKKIFGVQVDAGIAQVDSGYEWAGAVGIEAGRVDPFSLIVIEVKLDGHALGNARIPKAASYAAERCRAFVLDGECKPVGVGSCQLKTKVCSEGLHVLRGRIKDAPSLIEPVTGQK